MRRGTRSPVVRRLARTLVAFSNRSRSCWKAPAIALQLFACQQGGSGAGVARTQPPPLRVRRDPGAGGAGNQPRCTGAVAHVQHARAPCRRRRCRRQGRARQSEGSENAAGRRRGRGRTVMACACAPARNRSSSTATRVDMVRWDGPVGARCEECGPLRRVGRSNQCRVRCEKNVEHRAYNRLKIHAPEEGRRRPASFFLPRETFSHLPGPGRHGLKLLPMR